MAGAVRARVHRLRGARLLGRDDALLWDDMTGPAVKNSVCVIGLGNILLRDDAVGVVAAEAIKERYRFDGQVDVLDGGTAGFDLLPVIEGYNRWLFVDAIDAGEPPGTVMIVEGDALPPFLAGQVSVHHVGLSDLLFAARMAGSLPAGVCLAGIQPESVDIGTEMTDTLKTGLDLLAATVLRRLQEWGRGAASAVAAPYMIFQGQWLGRGEPPRPGRPLLLK